jgi:hypothetical protein
MASDRIQRRIDRLLDEAEAAIDRGDWQQAEAKAREVLAFDPESADARAFLAAAQRMGEGALGGSPPIAGRAASVAAPSAPTAAKPSAFVGGRYTVKRFLGEGGKKKVYLAHDMLLDRDVAFALIKTDGLDEAGRQRIRREAQAMGRLGAHPHIVSVFDLGEEQGQPYIVTELMGGGDVEGLLENASEHRPPLRRTLEIGAAVCRGLAFAHEQQIVHRDLKPGNVWLTADGVAKIGDFGLAVALDRSRLTQQGVMVGTVSYMPPEQALGGEVTPRADCYSLGAMLYEMVTGRPPFVGDDAIGVISQHINTAPVAPSWHNPSVPPALEGLILRLLAKSPAERPASAAEVLAALQAIDPDAPTAALSGANPLERVARGVFVGRDRELARLRAAFDDANAGRGGVVMIVGEPGIGKTRTAQELETYARIRGGQVLWGRAHEAAGAPAYWPWVQALRAYVAVVEPRALSTQLGSGAAEVARIVSEVRERLPGLPEPGAMLEPEAAQFRLFDAVASFLKNAAATAPLLVVLDDLHWADKPTLLLLQHVAREIGRSRLLVLGTYRDVEVGRAHPLAAALADMQRDALFQRVLLRGLSREEVEAYIRASVGLDPARELLAAIYQETEGSPFFLAEVVALMVQEGTLLRPASARHGGAAIAVPQSVREVLGRRLDRLSPECNELLTLAAVAGRDFTYTVLGAVSGHDDARLLALVEEAIEGRVIGETERPGAYRFSHALVQETLLGEISTTRRVRLHGQVGEALERLYGGQAERHAAELARHFVESATLTRAHAVKAVSYAELAAQQAEAATAWDEAARHYENCLALITSADDELGEDEPALLVALGRSYRNAAEWRPAWRHLMRAIALYEQRGDAVGLGNATLEAIAINAPNDWRAALLRAALAVIGSDAPYLEARLSLGLSEIGSKGDKADAATRAKELSNRHGYADVAARLTTQEAHQAGLQERVDEAGALYRAAYDALLSAGRPVEAVNVLISWAQMPSWNGRLTDGETALEEALLRAREFHLRFPEQGVQSALAGIALARSDFSRFEARLADIPGDYYITDLQRATRAAWSGEMNQAVALLPAPERAGGIPAFLALLHGGRSYIRLNAGDADGARHEFAAWADAHTTMLREGLGPGPFAGILAYAWIDEALPALGDEMLLRTAYERLVGWASVRFASWPARGIDHMRGALALRLGLIDDAETHYHTGLEWAERERCPVEQGRNLQGLAEVAERRGRHVEAVGYLDRAAALFQQHGTTLYLRQVLAKKEILKA